MNTISIISDEQPEPPPLSMYAVLAKLRQVWIEFYSWEQEASAQKLSSLCVQPPDETGPERAGYKSNNDVFLYNAIRKEEYTLPSLERSETHQDMIINAFSPRYNAEESSSTVYTAESIMPCPLYEACTPSLICLGPRPELETLSFIPHVDDKSFDIEKFTSLYENFSWIDDANNPDCEYYMPGKL